VIVGRILCGLALDRFPAHIVAATCFLIPSAGLAVLATGVSSVPLIAFSVMALGFSLGAEGDIAAYLVIRYFRAELFSTVLGLVAAAMACSALVGAAILSRSVAATGSYSLFLGISATTMFLGGLAFLLLRAASSHRAPRFEAADPPVASVTGQL